MTTGRAWGRDVFVLAACADSAIHIAISRGSRVTRKYNTTHPDRSLSGYHWNKKVRGDRYGQFDNGQQISPDYIVGKKLFYRDKEQEKEVKQRTGKWPKASRGLLKIRKAA